MSDIEQLLPYGALGAVMPEVLNDGCANRELQMARIAIAAMAEKEAAESRASLEAHNARHDSLTGMLNRFGMEELGNRRLLLDSNLALIFLDLDNFKYINDTYGHDTGDRLLVSTAKTIRQNIRKSDIAGRNGGDEFVILLDASPRDGDTDLTPSQRVQLIIDRIQGNIYDNAIKDGIPGGEYGISAGFVVFDPSRHNNLSDLSKDADGQMYIDKELRRNLPKDTMATASGTELLK